jgi:hypothetical protein
MASTQAWIKVSAPLELAFLGAVETHRRTFSPAAGADHRTVEVQSDTAQVELGDAIQDELSAQLS